MGQWSGPAEHFLQLLTHLMLLSLASSFHMTTVTAATSSCGMTQFITQICKLCSSLVSVLRGFILYKLKQISQHLQSYNTYESCMPSTKSTSALLPPWFPNNKSQEVKNKHGCFCKCTEKGFVVPCKNILWKENNFSIQNYQIGKNSQNE